MYPNANRILLLVMVAVVAGAAGNPTAVRGNASTNHITVYASIEDDTCFFSPLLLAIPAGQTRYLCCLGFVTPLIPKVLASLQTRAASPLGFYETYAVASGGPPQCPPEPPLFATKPTKHADTNVHIYQEWLAPNVMWSFYSGSLAVHCIDPPPGTLACLIWIQGQIGPM